jgi:hypothetical protein
MANTVFMMNKYHLNIYDQIYSDACLKQLLFNLEAFIAQYDFESNEFESFIAVFPNNHFESELDFEKGLWHVLNKLHEFDDFNWDSSVSDDPDNPNFSFSLKGKAFYIVGLYPKSSRIARQSPYTTFVFNLHWQFEKLRDMGSYKNVKRRIQKRDKKLQGSINPVLKDFGKESEAKQYSGRHIDKNWQCPFKPKTEIL